MWTLEVEGSLVAIDPSILGVPYWNCLKDPQGVFTQEYLGSFSGTGPPILLALNVRVALWI
jgi:hypothetical protein